MAVAAMSASLSELGLGTCNLAQVIDISVLMSKVRSANVVSTLLCIHSRKSEACAGSLRSRRRIPISISMREIVDIHIEVADLPLAQLATFVSALPDDIFLSSEITLVSRINTNQSPQIL